MLNQKVAQAMEGVETVTIAGVRRETDSAEWPTLECSHVGLTILYVWSHTKYNTSDKKSNL